MLSTSELLINQKTLSTLLAIKSNVILSYQVLVIIGLIDEGFFPEVKVTTKNESIIDAKIMMCSGHSFILCEEGSFIGEIGFTDINKIKIKMVA